jgi:elongation of very long chain fatty acids protein 6
MTAPSVTQKIGEILFTISELGATQFEKDFNHASVHSFFDAHWEVPIGSVVGYLLFCYFGIKAMDSSKPFGLKYPLAFWNLFLSTFSFIGMFRTVPYLLGELLTMDFRDTICAPAPSTYGNGPVGFWVFLFIISKIPELIDTVFIVLRKRDLIFLHWYHHVTVLLYCWHAYAVLAGSGIWFVAMNYSVHALMYFYFMMQALKMVPKGFPAYLITLAQIAQMFVGTGICIASWYYVYYTNDCSNDHNNLIAGATMYGSYLYLFVEFAVRRFLVKAPKTDKAAKPKKAD